MKGVFAAERWSCNYERYEFETSSDCAYSTEQEQVAVAKRTRR
jgi:hypothetical protein